MNNIEIVRITELPTKIIFQCFGDKDGIVNISNKPVGFEIQHDKCIFEPERDYFYFSLPNEELTFELTNSKITFGSNVDFPNGLNEGFHTLNTKFIKRNHNSFTVSNVLGAKKIIRKIKLNQFIAVNAKVKVNWVLTALFARTNNHWILSDRLDKSDDNAMWFAKFLSENTNEKVYYAISFSKTNQNELKKLQANFHLLDLDDANKNILLSKYKKKMLSAKFILSSHTEDNIYGFNFGGSDYFKYLKKYKYIFLQHGVMMSVVESDWLSGLSNKRDIWKIVTSNQKEDAAFSNPKLYHRFDNWTLKSTLPRFEFLENNENANVISIFPTWRKYDDEYEKNIRFKSVYKGWASLLSNKNFYNFLKSNGYKCEFVLHNELKDLTSQFKNLENDFITIKSPEEINYNEQNKSTKIAITDYSSAFIDAHYLNKKIIFYRFEELDNHHGKLLFEPNELGIEVASEIKELLNILNTNGKSINNSNFYFRKSNQCEFLYKKILEQHGEN